jgi:putative membrane protein
MAKLSLGSKQGILIALLVILYGVGLIGMKTDFRPFILSLSPFQLVVSFVCLMLSFSSITGKKIVDYLLIALCGFAVEWIGVHTHYLFGDYHYLNNLGPKWQTVPFLIALNWIMLSLISAGLFLKFDLPIWLKAVLGTLAMVFLDYLLEPIAAKSGFWIWKNNEIPLCNYICWAVFGFLFQLYLLRRKSVEQSQTGIALYVLLVLFFILLK